MNSVYVVLHTFETGCNVPYGAEVFTFAKEKSAFEKACGIIIQSEHYEDLSDTDIKHFCMMCDTEAWEDAYDFWCERFTDNVIAVIVNQSEVK